MPTALQVMELRLRSLEKSQENQNHSIDHLFRAIEKLHPGLMSQVSQEVVDELNREHGFSAGENVASSESDEAPGV